VVMQQSGEKVSDKKLPQSTPESSKSAKVGKQVEGKPVAGMKRFLESDSDDDDEDEDEEEDVDDDSQPVKKKPFVAKGTSMHS